MRIIFNGLNSNLSPLYETAVPGYLKGVIKKNGYSTPLVKF